MINFSSLRFSHQDGTPQRMTMSYVPPVVEEEEANEVLETKNLEEPKVDLTQQGSNRKPTPGIFSIFA